MAARVARKNAPAKKAAKKRAEPMPGFGHLVCQERKRLEKVRDNALARKAAIERELESVERDLIAIGSFLSGAVRTMDIHGAARRVCHNEFINEGEAFSFSETAHRRALSLDAEP